MLALFAIAASLAAFPPADRPATNIAEVVSAMAGGGAFRYDVQAQAAGVIRSSGNVMYVFVGDGTGKLFLMARDGSRKLQVAAGDFVRVRGEQPKDDSRYRMRPLCASSVERLAHAAPPAPVAATIAEVNGGSLDYAPVRTSGLVRDVAASETSRTWATISLFDSGQLLRVAVPLVETPVEEFAKLIGRRIEVVGFPNPRSGSMRLFAGRSFHCAGLSAIRALDETGADPFAAPEIGTIVNAAASHITSMGLVRAAGRVVCVWDGCQAMVKTKDRDFVRIVFDGRDLPKKGEFVECAGYPLTDAFHITLLRAKWRKSAPLDIPEDQAVAASLGDLIGGGAVSPEYHGRPVTLRGKAGVRLNDDGSVASVAIDDGKDSASVKSPGGWPDGLETGCEIAVTGICMMEAKRWEPELVVPKIRDATLVAMSPRDIRILSRPPWWTAARLGMLAASLVAALVAVSIWSASLKYLAERRGRQLLAEKIGRVKADVKTAERARLSVELHDSLAQNLAGVSLELQTAGRYGKGDIALLMRHLSIADTSLKSCLQNLRNTLWDLRSMSLDEPDFGAAVRRTLVPHVGGVELGVDLDVSRRKLTEQEAHDILRAVRELVVNAVRHGRAKAVRIEGSLDGETLRLAVSDDGCGFDVARAPGVADGHFGLQGVRDRLRGLGGTLHIESAAGRGTRAVLTARIGRKEC